MSIARYLHLRYSLKFLLLAMTLACIFTGYWVTSAKQQKQAVEIIQRAGGSVKYDYQLAGATEPPEPKWMIDRLGVDFFHTVEWAAEWHEMRPGDRHYEIFGKRGGGRVFADDAFVRVVDRLPRLKSLEVVTFDTSFAGLAFLSKLDYLQRFVISYRGAPDSRPAVGSGLARLSDRTMLQELSIKSLDRPEDGLAFLERLTDLQSLAIQEMPLEVDDFRIIASLPKLQKLNLWRSKVENPALQYVGKIKSLRALELWDTSIGSDGVRHLAGLTELRNLNLTDTGVDSNGIQHLSGLSKLIILRLDGTKVDNRAFETLKRMTSLTELWLSSEYVSREDAQELKQYLPNCRIALAR
jgi:hypothetical protein